MARLQGKVVNKEEKDKVISLETMSGTFSNKSFYSILEPRRSMLFLIDIVHPRQASLFGKHLGESSYTKLVLEERLNTS